MRTENLLNIFEKAKSRLEKHLDGASLWDNQVYNYINKVIIWLNKRKEKWEDEIKEQTLKIIASELTILFNKELAMFAEFNWGEILITTEDIDDLCWHDETWNWTKNIIYLIPIYYDIINELPIRFSIKAEIIKEEYN